MLTFLGLPHCLLRFVVEENFESFGRLRRLVEDDGYRYGQG